MFRARGALALVRALGARTAVSTFSSTAAPASVQRAGGLVGRLGVAGWECRVTSAATPGGSRGFATLPEDVQRRLDAINEKFAEAREEIECAMEDAETVYFNESAELAQQVTSECLALWAELLESVDADIKGQLLRSNGLKMEQLKAESKQLEHAHDD